MNHPRRNRTAGRAGFPRTTGKMPASGAAAPGTVIIEPGFQEEPPGPARMVS